MGDRWLTCALGPCNFEFMPQVLSEIVGRYDVDAIFANRWSGHITCYCDSCKSEFKKASGLEIAAKSATDGLGRIPALATGAAIRSLGRLGCGHTESEIGGMLLDEHGRRESNRNDPNRRACRDGGGGSAGARMQIVPPWLAGWNAKVFRSVMDDRPVAGITSVGNDDAHRWKDSVQPAAELRLWMLQCIANGMRPWVVKFCGTLYDKSLDWPGRRSVRLAPRE